MVVRLVCLLLRFPVFFVGLIPHGRTPNPSKEGRPIGVPMLWGGGTADSTDARRFSQFKNLKTVPTYVLGYEEPDCASGSGSAGMSVSAGVSDWESLVAPLGEKGALLGSPSMCSKSCHGMVLPKARTNLCLFSLSQNKPMRPGFGSSASRPPQIGISLRSTSTRIISRLIIPATPAFTSLN